MAATNVLSTREAAEKAAKAKDEAETAAREAAAAALRLFDNDPVLLAGLLDVPAEELERDAKPVTAARAKEVIETLRARAERPRPSRRPRTPRATSAPPPTAPAPVHTPDGGRPDAV
ncbi:hypothetical protein [Streptomyces bacillaris]|uniref:hypothetical protein n=1 Tax=Streptomyces bacillaris TaxID=68179 RepID=UPI0036FFABC0